MAKSKTKTNLKTNDYRLTTDLGELPKPDIDELMAEVQRLSPGFFPNRNIPTDWHMTASERLDRAGQLAREFRKWDIPVPAALLVML